VDNNTIVMRESAADLYLNISRVMPIPHITEVVQKSGIPVMVDSSNVLFFNTPIQISRYYESPTTRQMLSLLGVDPASVDISNPPYIIIHYGLPVGFLATK
jgi:hypothetical protein